MAGFSKGLFPIESAGTLEIVVKMVAAGMGLKAAYIKLKSGPCFEPKYKVVTAAGKVRTRAAAAAACQAQGRVLAPITSANMNDVLKVVRASPDVNLTVFDSVIIDSWNGDSYVGIDLELVVSKFGASVSMLVFPGYPLSALT
ncbi:hypothetical protein AMAG_19785 [Allomyces macrogynus ATCC 38327]|uniref:Uncharacterized protein n=1 Tax=Allomyces macrogynus (strain ATCC 38327) TaxID=578462 RepID=A0A0L0T0U9_ALLM3|nr:hypothetical protein AMAG_19785 [Allomyces macrogynus ATCC 38327]|eukprot:KNE68275.1 hypothetical protein AMAG_19785 [Allomyces macrogynus ATCC 38327]